MAWIESHQALLHHRKTSRLSRALSLPRVYCVGHLHALWWWCVDNAPSGDLTGIDEEDLADGAQWEGNPQHFIDALLKAGFVDADENGELHLHDWFDYAGKLIERRKEDAEWAQARRQVAGIVFERDGSRCAYCGATQDLTLDHVVPRVRGGGHEPANLVPACRSCNAKKGGRTPEEARMSMREADA